MFIATAINQENLLRGEKNCRGKAPAIVGIYFLSGASITSSPFLTGISWPGS